VLLERANLESRPAPELGYAWKQMLFTGGRLSTGRLADEVGWSNRHLGNRFIAEIGLTKKLAARAVRFDRARRRLGNVRARLWHRTSRTSRLNAATSIKLIS
jgi:transcriptional regulator GlxA family with amidase domain